MANNYETLTVLTALPPTALREVHRLALEGCGFVIAPNEDGSAYLYAEDIQPLSGDCFEMDRLAGDEDESPGTDGFRSALVADVIENVDLGCEHVLQRVLRDLPDSIPHIDAQGAYWCDKPRPGEFGGFAMRITRENIHQFSTQEWLQGLVPAIEASAHAATEDDDLVFVGGVGCFAEVPRGLLLTEVQRLARVTTAHALSEARAFVVTGDGQEVDWVVYPGYAPVNRVTAAELVVIDQGFHLRAPADDGNWLQTGEIALEPFRSGMASGERHFAETENALAELRDRVAAHVEAESHANHQASRPGPR